MVKRVAICLGLTRVDPNGYDGWDGLCPGCDIDVQAFAGLCHNRGFDGVHVLVNSAADELFLLPAFNGACDTLEAGDLLALYFSGHGGQLPDEDDDEEDGNDETLCLWSRELVDDVIAEYLQFVPPGVRIFIVTDSCHSGTNYRARTQRRESRPIDLVNSSRLLQPGTSLLHFGGCDDDRYSYGSEDGGEFTQRLIAVANQARKPITYREWFDRTFRKMPRYQTPTISAWGDSVFDQCEFLT